MPNSIRTIVVKEGASKVRNEYVANAAIIPGHILDLMSTGKVRVHPSANMIARPLYVALENELEGQGIDDAYAAADIVQVGTFNSGDELNILVADKAAAIVIGDKLSSAGDGTVKKWVVAGDSSDWIKEQADEVIGMAQAPLFQALEALDLSDSSGGESSGLIGDRRIKVRVL